MGMQALDEATSGAREQEERLALAMEAANDGVWDWNLETDEVYYAPRLKEMLGYKDWELANHQSTFERLLHPGDRGRVLTSITGYLAAGSGRYEQEFRLQHREGHYLDVLSRGMVVAKERNPARLVGSILDISARKRSEERLAARHAATEILASASGLKAPIPRFMKGICEAIRFDAGFAWTVRTATAELSFFSMWLGPAIIPGPWRQKIRPRPLRRGEGIPGKAWQEERPIWVQDATLQCVPPEVAIALGCRTAFSLPVRFRDEIVAVLEFFSRDIRPHDDPLLDALSSINGQIAQALERGEMQRQLQHAERKYREIIEHSLHGVYQTTREGQFLSANPALARLFGYDSPEELIGAAKDIEQRVYAKPEDRAAFIQLMDSQPIVSGFQSQARRKDGSVIWISESARAVRSESGELLYYEGFLEDITERKHAEQLKADFVSFATHQLRTPLSGIRWLLELAQQSEDREEMGSYIVDAHQSAQRLIDLVNDLLDASRLESGKMAVTPERTNLSRLAACVVQDLLPLAQQKGVGVSFTGNDSLPDVLADRQLARQVVLNLLSNAIKYTPGGGSVALLFRTENGHVEGAVSDTGIGVPATSKAKLFEKFYRADNAHLADTEGTGLGLYLIRLIVERSGGKVWCDSEEGVGSTFRFTFPLA
jgi:PAS domain S-box-containing protein